MIDKAQIQEVADIVRGVKGEGTVVHVYDREKSDQIAEINSYRDQCDQILGKLPVGDPARGRFLKEQLWCQRALAELGHVTNPNPGLAQGI